MVGPATRTKRIRHLARLATTLAAEHPRGQVFAPRDPKAFRRAFVAASLNDPFSLVTDETGTTTFTVGRTPIGRVCADGYLTYMHDRCMPHVLSPTNISALADFAFSDECEALRSAYTAQTGEKLQMDAAARSYDKSRPRMLQGLARRAVRAFCGKLQQEPLRALRRAMMASAGHRTIATDALGPSGWKWAQALHAYPAAINWAVGRGVASRDIVVQAIQSGSPLRPALAQALGITETEVRRLHGITPQRAGPDPGPSALRLLLDLPSHLRPRSRADWSAGVCLAWNIYRDPRLSFSVDTLVRGQPGPLSAVDPANDLRTLSDVLDAIQAMGPIGAAMLRRLETFSIHQLLSLNRDWHTRIVHTTHRLRAEAAKRNLTARPWPGALPETTMQFGDVVATELTTPADLLEEGASLEHCVAGYGADCYEGRSRILSLRCMRTSARSTLELQQQREGRGWTVWAAQHEGPENTPPAATLQAAATAILRALNADRIDRWPQLPDESPKAVSWAAIIEQNRDWLLRRVKPLAELGRRTAA